MLEEQTMKKQKGKTTSCRSDPNARAELVARRPTATLRTCERLRPRARGDGIAERPDSGSGEVRVR